jgi:hypothetical protein
MFVLAVGFAAGVVHLFLLRFEAGDVYAPYSSLRADPLGTKILCESLRRLPDISVRRHYQSLSKLRDVEKVTVFCLGTGSPYAVSRDLVEGVESLAVGGGRLVISFRPSTGKPWSVRRRERKEHRTAREEQGEKPEESPGKKNEQEDQDDSDKSRLPWVSLDERWGLGLDYAELPVSYDSPYGSTVAHGVDVETLPDSISWHTALFFDKLEDAWRVVYAREGRPVIIERSFGKGTLVLSADSYYLSNEAMRSERHPELLAWLVGPNRTIVFDEAHLGLSEHPGIAALVRKYRLHGVVAGCLLLAGLFVWKNAVSFVPPYEDEPGEREVAAGRDFAAALTNLLRRSISQKDILSVCLDEWKRSVSHARKDLRSRVEMIEGVLEQENARPAKRRDAVRCYRTISRMLAERKNV